MSDVASDVALVPLSDEVQRLVDCYHVSPIIAEDVVLTRLLVERVKQSSPAYLELPAVVRSVADAPLYAEALHYGRFWYRDLLTDLDESGELVHVPLTFTRAEVLEMVRKDVQPVDRRLAVSMPLAWRVGFSVGWLSALSSSQKDEAQAGMVMLAALVAPLLLKHDALAVPALGPARRARK